MATSQIVLITTLILNPAIPQSVDVTLLNGDRSAGQLQSIADGEVSLDVDGSRRTILLDDVLEITFPETERVAAQPEFVRLTDGTGVSCAQIQRTAQLLTCDSPLLGSLAIPAARVASVRLQPAEGSTATQWQAFVDRKSDKDLLVVPKRDGSGLDFLSGIVNSIGETEISFLLDGDTIPVPRPRVFGIVFAAPATPASSGLAGITTTAGDLVVVSAIRLTEGTAAVTTSWNQSLTVPVSHLSRIDFSLGRIHYLSDLTPLAENFMGIDPDGDLFAGLIDDQTARRLYGPSRDRTIENRSPLRLRGRTFDRGLCIHSKTELVFALDRKYKSFEAIAGVDDQVAFNLDREVLLVITADGDEILRHTFQTREDPMTISLPVEDVQTLSILVDYADNNSQCDWLDLADARLILAGESP